MSQWLWWMLKSRKTYNRIADHLKKCGLYSDFQYGIGLLDQLLIFSREKMWSQLYLIELLGLLTGLGLLRLWHWIYPRLLTGFNMLVFFTNLSFMEFQVRYLVLFLLFLVIDNLEWFWMERQSENKIWSVNRMLHEKPFSWKNIQKMQWRNYSQTLF